jgi:hypothetical protein
MFGFFDGSLRGWTANLIDTTGCVHVWLYALVKVSAMAGTPRCLWRHSARSSPKFLPARPP